MKKLPWILLFVLSLFGCSKSQEPAPAQVVTTEAPEEEISFRVKIIAINKTDNCDHETLMETQDKSAYRFTRCEHLGAVGDVFSYNWETK